MIDIVGYEGAPAGDFLVAWGAAAVRDGESLVNPATGTRVEWSKEEVAALAENGDLVLLAKPLPLDDEFAAHHLIVLHVAKLETFAKALYIDTQQAGGVLTSRRTKNAHFYVFENEVAFDQMARKLCTQIVTSVLFDNLVEGDRDRLIEAGLVLNSHDPFVNALRVWFSPRRKALREVVSGKLSSFERGQFDELLESLEMLDRAKNAETVGETLRSEYFLKYQNGLIPSGGGLDVNVALRAVSAMNAVSSELQQIVAADYPFIDEPAPLHMQGLVAASAEFHFATTGDSLGDRLSRLLQLRYLSRALEGDETRIPPHVLLKLTELGDETELRHKPVGERTVRDVAPPTKLSSKAKHSEPFHVLGYQSGLVNEGKRVEITFFPGRRVSVGTTDNGDGEVPLNLAFLETSSDFLFRPTLYTLVRAVDEKGREIFFLRDVREVRPKFSGTISAIPSSIVPGSLIHGLRFAVSSGDGGALVINGLGTVNALSGSAEEARGWISAYRALCLEYELEPSQKPVRRLRPPRYVATAIGRLVATLDDLGGAERVSHLVTEINERFGTSVRVNNTRREVLMHDDLLEFDTDDPRRVRLTPRGKLYASAYRHGGGGVRRDEKAH